PLADFRPEEIERLSSLLNEMAADLAALSAQELTLEGFSVTLTEAYEHIQLTQSLARAVRNVEQPEQFFTEAVESLATTLPFGWITISLFDAPWLEPSERRCTFTAGETPPDDYTIDALTKLAELDEDTEGSVILSGGQVDTIVGPDEQVVIHPISRTGVPSGVLVAGSKGGHDPQVSTYDTRLIDAVGAFVSSYYAVVCLVTEQQATFLGSMRAISAALDAKDRYTRGHSERVAHLAATLAERIGLPEATVERIHIAGLMHDVGKIGVPEAVLCKPGRLTDEEFDAIKRHPRIGHDILAGIPQLEDILPGVLWHHERWDGRGYPDRLAGEDIPLMGRLLAIADTFDAMSSNRSYRSKMSRQEVLTEIGKCAGTQFDPDLVPPFLEMDFSEFDRMVADHAPQRIVGRDAA
ncbi:MAG: HD-GYP domain-containing protein, partial [Phycisphaerales bacterium JB041]